MKSLYPGSAPDTEAMKAVPSYPPNTTETHVCFQRRETDSHFRRGRTLSLFPAILLGLSMWLVCQAGLAATIHVDSRVAASGDGSSWSAPWKTIGEALSAAAAGDEIWVAQGTYREAIAIARQVAVYGGFAGTETNLSDRSPMTNPTILDGSSTQTAQQARHVVLMDGTTSSTLDGFIITGGSASSIEGDSSPSNGRGGGVYVTGQGNTVSQCIIVGNRAALEGGGIYCEDAILSNCHIAGNSAERGGGIRCKQSVLRNCIISKNWTNAKDSRLYDMGNGLCNSGEKETKVVNCTISGNAPDYQDCSVSTDGPIAITNTIFEHGQGIDIHMTKDLDCSVESCLFSPHGPGYACEHWSSRGPGGQMEQHLPGAHDLHDGDAKFRMGPDGVWAADAVYDGVRNRTVLVAVGSSYAPGCFVGQTMNPTTSSLREAVVTSNTTTVIEVSGDMTQDVSAGISFSLTDYHLQNGSYALDRGTTVTAPQADMDGDPRPGADGLVDIGADEAEASWEPPADITPPTILPLWGADFQRTLTFDVNWWAWDSETGLQDVELYYQKDGGPVVRYGGKFQQSPIRFDASQAGGNGIYGFYMTATDKVGNRLEYTQHASYVTEVVVSQYDDRLYVNARIPESGYGNTWANAKKTIQEALDRTYPGEEIWVAQGTYVESLRLRSGIAVYGGFAGTETLRSQRSQDPRLSIVMPDPGGSSAWKYLSGVSLEGVTTATLDSFTITSPKDFYPFYRIVSGVKCTSAGRTNTISNCIITGNKALGSYIFDDMTDPWLEGIGGGIICESSSPVFDRCVITDNSATDYGGGIYCSYSNPTLKNCVIARNSVRGLRYSDYWHALPILPLGWGGGIYCLNSSPVVSNCTITSNTALWGDAGVSCDEHSHPLITNTIFSKNVGCAVVERDEASSTVLSNCLFFGNTKGDYVVDGLTTYTGGAAINSHVPGAQSNMDGDPAFVDEAGGDYHLTPLSPCIDTGRDTSPAEYGGVTTDFDGDARPYGPAYDIGADEFTDTFVHTPGKMLAYVYVAVLGRLPTQAEAEAWLSSRFDFAVDAGIDIRLVWCQTEWSLFQSQEYASRHRSDEDFIRDCYSAFLQRSPGPDELAAWLAGSWRREEALITFWNSREFADLVAKGFPAFQGDPVRTFVASIYLGCLERFPGGGELGEWCGKLERYADKRGVVVELVSRLLTSEEFLRPPAMSDNRVLARARVIALYRSLLGRFPGEQEETYWTEELLFGRRSLQMVIEGIAGSPECTARLRGVFQRPDPASAACWMLYP